MALIQITADPLKILQKKLGDSRPLQDGWLVVSLLQIHHALMKGADNLEVVLNNIRNDDVSEIQKAKKNLVELVVAQGGSKMGRVLLIAELLLADPSNLNEEEKGIRKGVQALLSRLLEDNNQFGGKNRKLNYLILNLLLECYADIFCCRLHEQEADRGEKMANMCHKVAMQLLQNKNSS